MTQEEKLNNLFDNLSKTNANDLVVIGAIFAHIAGSLAIIADHISGGDNDKE